MTKIIIAVTGALAALGLIGLVAANTGDTRNDRQLYICEDTSTGFYQDWLPNQGSGLYSDTRAELVNNCANGTAYQIHQYACWLESRLSDHRPNSTSGWPTYTWAGAALAHNAMMAENAVRVSRGWHQYTRDRTGEYSVDGVQHGAAYNQQYADRIQCVKVVN